MKKTNSKAEDLLRLLGSRPAATHVESQKPTPATPPKRPEPAAAVKAQEPRVEVKKEHPPAKKLGHAVQFWLHPEDEKLIREFFVWLAPHRKRVNATLVIKTVLRAARTGPDFLAAYDKALEITTPKSRKRPRAAQSEADRTD